MDGFCIWVGVSPMVQTKLVCQTQQLTYAFAGIPIEHPHITHETKQQKPHMWENLEPNQTSDKLSIGPTPPLDPPPISLSMERSTPYLVVQKLVRHHIQL
jgi:hypothetical protein